MNKKRVRKPTTKYLVTAFALALLPWAEVGHALPTAYYNPATGGIYLKNDTGGKLSVVAIYSETINNVARTDPSLYATIPGAIFDSADLPYGFTYLNFPRTDGLARGIHIGDVIATGIPTSALTGVWYPGSLFTGLPFQLTITEIPEPTALALSTAFFFLVAAKRRRA